MKDTGRQKRREKFTGENWKSMEGCQYIDKKYKKH